VIGGTSGIGQAIALGLARAGASVVASSRSAAGVETTAAELERMGSRTRRFQCDVTRRESIEELCQAVLEEFGGVDILVNSAGVTKRVVTLDCSEEDWNRIMHVNLKGTLYGCQAFGKGMLEQGHGSIVNIASLSTYVAFHEVAAYGASKAAVAALTRSLAVEWADRGVRVNAVTPGIVPTELNRKLLDSPRGHELLMRTPMGRFGTAEEVVGAAVYLASDASAFVTGQVIVVDGGFLASGVNQ
jgi:NAD(P)-dependent dehydrogenase (short-subunit alcohol dehydrogenase family)